MASIWSAPADIVSQVHRIKDSHHPLLSGASVWVLCSDANPIRDNKLVATLAAKATKHEKLATGHDFKITVLIEAWANLPDVAREIVLDEALCRCGVKFVPQTVEINGKKEVVKDDLGRTVFTDEIAVDKDGEPKWKINKPDAGIFFAMMGRHGDYCEELERLHKVRAGEVPAVAVTAQD